jgi:hypothetical protein
MKHTLNPLTSRLIDAFTAVRADEACSHVELRYSSPDEFEYCVLVGKWLMKKFADRALKVSIVP